MTGCGRCDNGYNRAWLKSSNKGGKAMKVEEGDVLICSTEDCEVELTVTRACKSKTCGAACEIEATCCDEPMELK